LKSVVLSGSFKDWEDLRRTCQRIITLDMLCHWPKYETPRYEEDMSREEMATALSEHLKRIVVSDAMYVVNPTGYIGKGVSFEIGYAHALGKPIFSQKDVSEVFLRSAIITVVPIERLADELERL